MDEELDPVQFINEVKFATEYDPKCMQNTPG
jgi:hypothetical protein